MGGGGDGAIDPDGPVGAAVTDARQFLGMEPVGTTGSGGSTVVPELATPGHFLFGGCGLGAALVALEAASGRPTVWSTAQYLSYAPTHSVLDLTVTLAAEGDRVTQARAVGYVGDQEILTVNAAIGVAGRLRRRRRVGHRAGRAPARRSARPAASPTSPPPPSSTGSTSAWPGGGRSRRSPSGTAGPGDPASALWARVPGHLEPSAATLAIIGDYVTGGVSQPLGRRVMSRSLDNTIRVVHLEPTEWVLCDIRIQALVGGYGQGVAYLWSERGALLATASQSMSVRVWD